MTRVRWRLIDTYIQLYVCTAVYIVYTQYGDSRSTINATYTIYCVRRCIHWVHLPAALAAASAMSMTHVGCRACELRRVSPTALTVTHLDTTTDMLTCGDPLLNLQSTAANAEAYDHARELHGHGRPYSMGLIKSACSRGHEATVE